MRWSPSQWTAGVIGWSVAALAVPGGALGIWAAATDVTDSDLSTAIALVPFVVAGAVVGAIIVSRAPSNPIGWLFLVLGLEMVVATPMEVASAAWIDGDPAPSIPATIFGVIGDDFGAGCMYVPVVFLLLLFPTGRPLTERWRWFARFAAVAITLTLAVVFVTDDEVPYVGGENPIGFVPVAVRNGFAVVMLLVVLGAALSVVLRFRRARGVERQQLRWFAASATFTAITIVLGVLGNVLLGDDNVAIGAFWIVIGLGFTLVPISVGIAMTRHRLFDLELVVSRTLVYGILTASVLAVYALAVWASGRLAESAGDAAALIAAAVVAVAGVPLRDRLQWTVNRALFGHRDEPLAALNSLGERLAGTLAPEAVLPALVEAVAQALRVPHVAVELRETGEWREEARHGRPRGERLEVPLLWEGEVIGRLLVSPRTPDEPLDERDHALLGQIARQAGSAVHGVQLGRELQRSRERLVAAREEERRRIRRDLHDGLGPQLAAIGLQLRAAARVAGDEAVAALATDLQRQVRGAIDDVRRLVDDLRPPQLDEYGLAGALRNHAARFRSQLDVEVHAPEELQPLPAAVEVAAYRIATEALANAARHAEARRCAISLRVNGALEVEIVDDGSGMPVRPHPGIGLGSMRERAAELGGSCRIEPAPGGGTRVLAQLPLPAEAA